MSTALSDSYVVKKTSTFLGSASLNEDLIDSLVAEVVFAAVGDDASMSAVTDVVASAVEAFLEANGIADVAARKVGRQLRQLGVGVLAAETDLQELTRAFERVNVAAVQAAHHLFRPHLDHDRLIDVLSNIAEYLSLLYLHARHGLSESHRLRELDDARREEELRRALFHTAEPIDVLANLVGRDLRTPYVAVVSVGGPLPDTVLENPDTIVGNRAEAVIPPVLLEEPQVLAGIQYRMVAGPAVPLESVPEAVELTRRAARLLATGTVTHPGPIVPCGDMIGFLAIAGSPLLNELAAHKHLAPMLTLRKAQRLDYAQLLLLWLERGQPLAQIANLLSVPSQTVHHRFTVIRQLYGERLDDPNTRLEILVALRHVLPRWRAELASTIPAARHRRKRP